MKETPIEFYLQKQLPPNVIKISLYESNHRSKEKGSLQENSNLTKTSVNSNIANMINRCGSVKLSRQMFFASSICPKNQQFKRAARTVSKHEFLQQSGQRRKCRS